MRRCVLGDSSGQPTPRRRTFATALQAFAHSMPASLSASMPALAANAGSVARATPREFMRDAFKRKSFLRLQCEDTWKSLLISPNTQEVLSV